MNDRTEKITIDWKWVEAHLSAKERLGKISEGETKEAVLTHLKEALKTAGPLAKPRIASVRKEIARFHATSIELKGGMILSSKELASHMKGARDLCVFLVTIGKDLEDAASSYMKDGDHLTGYLLDRIGSFAVESLAKNAEEELRRALSPEELSVSMRFSPGYCDWHIEEQFKLAQILNFEEIGVTLTKGCMMIPKKSISAVAGIGPKKLFAKIKSPCALCNMKFCDYRRMD